MAGNDELFKAFGMFQQGLQQYATSSAIGDAADQVRQLNSQTTNELERRQKVSEVGNNLALHLNAIGAPAGQIASTMQSIMPSQIKDANDLYLQGAMLGDKGKQLSAMAPEAQKFQMRPDLAKIEASNAGDMAKQRLMGQQAIDLERLKASERGPAEAKAGDISFATNVEMANTYLDELAGVVPESGTWEMDNMFAVLSDRKNAAKLKNLPTQFAQVYAKIVDPETAAREGEVELAKKFLSDFGAFTSSEAAMESIAHMKQSVQQYAQARARAKAQGRNYLTPAEKAKLPKAASWLSSAKDELTAKDSEQAAWLAKQDPNDPKAQAVQARMSLITNRGR